MSKVIISSSNNLIRIANNQFEISDGQYTSDSGTIIPQADDAIRFYFVQCVGSEWDGTSKILPLAGSFSILDNQGTVLETINVSTVSGETFEFVYNEGEQIPDITMWVKSVTQTGPNEYSCEVTSVWPTSATGFDLTDYASGDTINIEVGAVQSPLFFDFTPALAQPGNITVTAADPSIVNATISPGPDATSWSLNLEALVAGTTTITLDLYAPGGSSPIDSKTYGISSTIRYATYYNLYQVASFINPGDTINVKNKNNTTDLSVEFDGVPYGFNISTDDSNIATAVYDSSNRMIQITPVADGTTGFTVEFTHEDGTVDTNTYTLNVYTPSYATDFEIVGYSPNDTIGMREGQTKNLTINYIGGDEPYEISFSSDDYSICSPNPVPSDIYALQISNNMMGTATLTITMTLSGGSSTITHTYTVNVQQRIAATGFDLDGYSEGDIINLNGQLDINVLLSPEDSSIEGNIYATPSDYSILNVTQYGDSYNPGIVLSPVGQGTTTLTVTLEDTQGSVLASKQYTVDVSFSPTPTGMGFLGENAVAFFKGKLNDRILINYGTPDENQVGTIGQLLEDKTNGKLYICTNDSYPYAWAEVGTGGAGADVFTTNEWDALWT